MKPLIWVLVIQLSLSIPLNSSYGLSLRGCVRYALRKVSPQKESQVLAMKEPELLDMNENPYGSSPRVARLLKDYSRQASYYSRTDEAELKLALSKKHNVLPENITLKNGSDEVIFSALKNMVAPGKNIVTPDLEYFKYKNFSQELDIAVKKAKLGAEFKMDTNTILSAVDENTGLVVISNPSNPTGDFLKTQELSTLASALAEKKINLIVDSAYREYATSPLIADPFQIARDHPNVLVIGTFSKAYGLAGMRVGYGIGAPGVVAALEPTTAHSVFTTLSLKSAIEALKDDAFVASTKLKNDKMKSVMMANFPKYGIRPYPSQTSFVLVDTPILASEFTRLLLDKGIRIRDLSPIYQLTHQVRITVGDESQVNKLLKALDELKKAGLLTPH